MVPPSTFFLNNDFNYSSATPRGFYAKQNKNSYNFQTNYRLNRYLIYIILTLLGIHNLDVGGGTISLYFIVKNFF
ncbi:hypothetical protein BpHYR1_052781 [Brachionus plicatilis]|uniref:Uncharacterized protein n=1 Tax=Brachionus plicatilis TaxID=10195 RepID=A0A3M7T1F1_BRAPC|nr:hypothetical protein BpHYR1_052781 [Brachionus plicatilis]